MHSNAVIVLLEDSTETPFKQVVVGDGMRYLKPLNPHYPIMRVGAYAAFCRVVVQTAIGED